MNSTFQFLKTLGLVAFLFFGGGDAFAQQGPHVPAPTQPGKGVWILETTWNSFEFTRNGAEKTDSILSNRLTRGLSGDWSAFLEEPLMDLSQAGDLRVGLRHRLWQKDTASVDTERFGLSGGLRLPTGATAFSTDQVAPFFGASWMKISGRQGLNLAAVWREGHGSLPDPVRPGDGERDLLELHGGFLWRMNPVNWGSGRVASTYATVELSGYREGNGDSELLLAPGILYEAPTWAGFLTLQIPALDSLDHRPERGPTLTAGIRIFL